MRKYLFLAIAILSVASFAACDPKSEMAKKGVEKFAPTPTPSVSPTPTEEPIDPADVVSADTSNPGPTVTANTDGATATCSKYNRLMVNGSGRKVTAKGVCSQVMVNGNGNDVTIEAAAEVVFNGSENTLRYSKIGNGKRPSLTDNGTGNVIEKVKITPVR